MIFVDKASVVAHAGKGGDGAVSFRQEPFVSRGGPDGGDGGHGGSVVAYADRNLNTLAAFRQRQLLEAQDGGKGTRARRHGKNGDDLRVAVPIGTTIIAEDGEELADLKEDGDEVIIARGGEGGFGNAHFTSSTRQAPNFAEKGEAGEHFELTFELKMIADVGLVGLPNAGKSTFLSVVSNARPDIADYPFTTLTPNLGVADVGDGSLLIADIPGLIEGASEGKGLGDEFLRHVERTAVLIHLIDIYSNDIAADYTTIMNELKAYKVDLTTRPMVIALTKTENIDEDIINMQLELLQPLVGDTEIFTISSVAKQGTGAVLNAVKAKVEAYRIEEAERIANRPTVVRAEPEALPWRIVKRDDDIIEIRGGKIERFARRTDFSNDQAVGRILDIMKKMGIERELQRRQVEPGTTIQIGPDPAHRLHY